MSLSSSSTRPLMKFSSMWAPRLLSEPRASLKQGLQVDPPSFITAGRLDGRPFYFGRPPRDDNGGSLTLSGVGHLRRKREDRGSSPSMPRSGGGRDVGSV